MPFFKAALVKFAQSPHKKTRMLVIMLNNLLKFNPYFRPTALECLTSKVFDNYRDHRKENILSEMVARHSELKQTTHKAEKVKKEATAAPETATTHANTHDLNARGSTFSEYNFYS